ncbi:MAG: DUF4124 domain-containing protein [Rhodoferax sp.]|nr:DUF4124 domain-containing protein [Rhodoferax sp.]MCB2027611.1 DUF4124 domain-containing protein [Rhodoferax sp.]MCB2039985.1 DUF4124 domain-containing protein [Rhodoferax sp.]MCP5260339.1 DUF4124 domain-containing protein [Rhodoferax sp.]
MRRIRTLLVCSMWLIAATAQAQWQWIDKSGRKVYSDQPPPSDIPVKNILKQPGKTTVAPAAVNAAAPAPATAPAAASGPAAPQLGDNDKDLQAKTRQAEAEAKAKVKAEAERLAKVRSTNCEKARANQALMDSGVRVSITNAKGEREILDDAARAAEQKKIQTVIATNCD